MDLEDLRDLGDLGFESEVEVVEEEVTFPAKLRIINPSVKSRYVMVKCQPLPTGVNVDEIKTIILNSFPNDICKPERDKIEFGYFEPGRGLKGKKEWILDRDDIVKMFERHIGRKRKSKEITLWCYHALSEASGSRSSGSRSSGSRPSGSRSPRSRSKSPIAKKPRSSRYDSQLSKMAKVDEIYHKLEGIHENKFSPEQLTAWAHLIEMGRHHSYNVPPKKRFYQHASVEESAQRKPSDAPSTSVTQATGKAASPQSRLSVRSEYIDQLQKWHSLFSVGAVSKEQYEELQTTILSDIQNLT